MSTNIARIIMRRDTTQNWELANPILSRGEFGVEIQESGNRRIKTGDGIASWNELNYSYISAEEFTGHLADSNAHDIEDIINAVNGDIALIRNSMDVLTQTDADLINRVTDAEGGIIQNAGSVEALELRANQDRQNNENNFNTIDNSINTWASRVNAFEVWRNIMDTAFTDLSNTVSQNNNNSNSAINGLAGRVNALEIADAIQAADIGTIKADIEDIRQNTDLASLQNTIQRVNNLENGVSDLEHRSSVLETKVSNNITSIDSINGNVTNIMNRLGTLELFDTNISQQFNDFRDSANQRFDGIDTSIFNLDTSVTSLKWLTDQMQNIQNQQGQHINTLRFDFDNFVIDTNNNFVQVREAIANETETRQIQVIELSTAIENEANTRQTQIDQANQAIQNEANTRQEQVNNLTIAIENEAILRNRQIVEATTAEASARESQINEVNNAMTNGFAELNGQIQATNSVIDGIRTTSLRGAYLTRELGGATDVPIHLFGSFSNFQAGKTLVFDDNGTQGVFIGNVDSATIRVMTKSISHMSDLKPTLLGSVPTFADLPMHADTAASLFGRVPRIDDHAFVLNDETHDDLRVIWYVIDIVEIPYEGDAYGMIPFPPPPPTIELAWGNPIPINRDDFQAQTGAVDSGRVLTGGATPGTFGESIPIDVEATEGSNNLITSDAVYQAMEQIREENSFSTDESYTGQSWIDNRPIFRRVLTGNTGTTSPTLFGVIPNLGSFVNIRGHIRNPNFIDNINTVDINFETGELRGHWPENGVINEPVWNWWNVGSPTINFAATGSHNNINGLNVGRLGGATGGITWGPAGFAMGGNRFTIGAVSPSGTTETTPSMRIAGVLDFTLPTLLEVDFGSASGAGAFQVSINNNTISMANSVHGNASRVVNQTMSGSGTFSTLIDTSEWTAGRGFLSTSTITFRGEGTLTMQIFGIRLLRRTSWENSEFNIIFEYTRENN